MTIVCGQIFVIRCCKCKGASPDNLAICDPCYAGMCAPFGVVVSRVAFLSLFDMIVTLSREWDENFRKGKSAGPRAMKTCRCQPSWVRPKGGGGKTFCSSGSTTTFPCCAPLRMNTWCPLTNCDVPYDFVGVKLTANEALVDLGLREYIHEFILINIYPFRTLSANAKAKVSKPSFQS